MSNETDKYVINGVNYEAIIKRLVELSSQMDLMNDFDEFDFSEMIHRKLYRKSPYFEEFINGDDEHLKQLIKDYDHEYSWDLHFS